jgi:hypothetical protein
MTNPQNSRWVRVQYLDGGPDADPATEPDVGTTIDFVRGPLNGEWLTGTGKVRVLIDDDGRELVSVEIPVDLTRKFTMSELDDMGLEPDGPDQIAWRYAEDDTE